MADEDSDALDHAFITIGEIAAAATDGEVSPAGYALLIKAAEDILKIAGAR